MIRRTEPPDFLGVLIRSFEGSKLDLSSLIEEKLITFNSASAWALSLSHSHTHTFLSFDVFLRARLSDSFEPFYLDTSFG